jgi:hypothetical protein
MTAWTELGALATAGTLALALGGAGAILLAQLPLRQRPLRAPRYRFDAAAALPRPEVVRPPAVARSRVRAISAGTDPATLACCRRPGLSPG